MTRVEQAIEERTPASAATASATRLRWLVRAAACLFALFVLAILFQTSALIPLNSDHVQAFLEAGDVLAGNVLLHGWVLALQNYFLSDLPFFLVTRLLFGKTLLAIYAAPFLIYVAFLAAATAIVWRGLAARGRAVGMAAVLFYLATPGLHDLAPLVFAGTQHVATMTFCLLAWLALDRYQRLDAQNAWLLYLGCAFVAFLSDPLSLFILLIPTLIGLTFALAARAERRTQATLIGLTITAYVAARIGLVAVKLGDGFLTTFPESVRFADASEFGNNLASALYGLMALSGGAVFGRPVMSGETILMMLRLLGLAAMAVAVVAALRRRIRAGEAWDLRFVLAVAVAIQLASCLTSADYTESLHTVAPLRFLVPVILFGGIVAALELPGLLHQVTVSAPRWIVSGLAGIAFFAAMLSFAVGGAEHWHRPPAMAEAPARIADNWLLEHGLTHGVGTYWEGMLMTALSGERVAVRAVFSAKGRLRPYAWVTKLSWYDERPQFVIYRPGNEFDVGERTIVATYGPPVRIEHIDGYDVAVLAPAPR